MEQGNPFRFKVTALEAAQTQLDRAINLYFEDADPVSCHSLASNAMEIIGRIAETAGVRTLRVRLKEVLDDTRFKEAHDTIHLARNFFKHAKRGDELIFDDDWNMFVLANSSFTLNAIGNRTNASLAFMLWISQLFPELLSELNVVFRRKLPSLDILSRSHQKLIGRDQLKMILENDMKTLLDRA